MVGLFSRQANGFLVHLPSGIVLGGNLVNLKPVDAVLTTMWCSVTVDSSRVTAKGYSELGQRDVTDGKEDTDSDAAESEDSDLDDTDSEFGE